MTFRQSKLSRRAMVVLLAGLVFSFASCEIFLKAPALHAAENASGAEAPHAAVDVHTGDHAARHLDPAPSIIACLPFVALLLCVALLPLFHKTSHWWEANRNKLLASCGFGVAVLAYYVLLYGHGINDHMSHQTTAPGIAAAVAVFKNAFLVEYIPFMTLLFSLYVISGGIAVEGNFVGHPRFNTAIIGIGCLMASLVGTTGAAMLLIRPLLKANARRKYVADTVVFFTFIVCNTGGCLLPIGDPPLFLGFLRGVPFFWTLSLWPQFLFMNISLLAVYFVWDTITYRQENKADVEAAPETIEKFAIHGRLNLVWLVGVILSVSLLDPAKTVPGTNFQPPMYFREAVMLLWTVTSLVLTPTACRQRNSFNYDAILEVAALFIGVFICMQAPIQILNVHGSSLGINEPWKFYWCTGALSSFLDNAPTYVVFFQTAKSLPATAGHTVAGVDVLNLAAISLGAVFMGAMTYIGNGPNFMVKAIAEKNHVKMPSFFGYMIYSCSVLLPLSVIMTLIFFRS